MARQKTPSESVRARLDLAERLVALRSELYGNHGAPELARRLGIPPRTWYNYEKGVTVPAEIILKVINVTLVEPRWLLNGNGPKFRHARTEHVETTFPNQSALRALLRAALDLLEKRESLSAGPKADCPATECVDRSPTAVGVWPLVQELSTVRGGRWSGSSAMTSNVVLASVVDEREQFATDLNPNDARSAKCGASVG
jgi:hypothetical protein